MLALREEKTNRGECRGSAFVESSLTEYTPFGRKVIEDAVYPSARKGHSFSHKLKYPSQCYFVAPAAFNLPKSDSDPSSDELSTRGRLCRRQQNPKKSIDPGEPPFRTSISFVRSRINRFARPLPGDPAVRPSRTQEVSRAFRSSTSAVAWHRVRRRCGPAKRERHAIHDEQFNCACLPANPQCPSHKLKA